MPVLVCPRCQRANPEAALFCHFDGIELKPGAGAALQKLAREFVFPSGRCCRSFDEFAQGCQDDWPAARDFLKSGKFGQYFSSIHRLDLARAAQEAMAQKDPDIALATFLGLLPVSRTQMPRLDLNPRRILLGNLRAGETRQVQLTVSNQGQGVLQGTLKVTDGNEYFRIAGANGECPIKTPREQQITLQVDARKLQAAQTYGAKLTVVTNGGIVEVPVKMDVIAQPFARSPFQGAKTPREMAVLMRGQPKQAVPLLESGEIGRWFASNGWSYPVRGTPARGVAGVQQFFEAMGLSKPPPVLVSQPELRFTCQFPESVRGQINMHTPAKKWVYANVDSNSPWLRVLTPAPAGPQQAAIGFEIDSRQVPDRRAEGKLTIVANAGQTLTVRVGVEVRGTSARRRRSGGVLQSIVTMALAFLIVRVLLVPFVDGMARGTAARSAAARAVIPLEPDSPINHAGGWLTLPWNRLLLGNDALLPLSIFNPDATGVFNAPEYRHYLISYFIRYVVLWTWWIGAVWGAVYMSRRGGPLDVVWGIIAGAVAGLAVTAILACGFLVVEIVPLALWWGAGNLGLLIVWIVLALVYWTLLGAVVGLLLGWIAPLKRTFIAPVQGAVAGLCRLCGLRGLAAYCAPA